MCAGWRFVPPFIGFRHHNVAQINGDGYISSSTSPHSWWGRPWLLTIFQLSTNNENRLMPRLVFCLKSDIPWYAIVFVDLAPVSCHIYINNIEHIGEASTHSSRDQAWRFQCQGSAAGSPADVFSRSSPRGSHVAVIRHNDRWHENAGSAPFVLARIDRKKRSLLASRLPKGSVWWLIMVNNNWSWLIWIEEKCSETPGNSYQPL